MENLNNWLSADKNSLNIKKTELLNLQAKLMKSKLNSIGSNFMIAYNSKLKIMKIKILKTTNFAKVLSLATPVMLWIQNI